MSERRNWWSDGIRKGWLGRYESELVYFLREKTGRLTNDEQLVLVFLSLFLKSGHTTLPLGLSPKKWGEVVGLPPESIALLPGKKIQAGDLLKNEKLASGSLEPFTPLVATPERVSFRKQFQYESSISQWIAGHGHIGSTMPDPERIRKVLDQLFPMEDPGTPANWQKVAAALSVIRPFTIISGGPGTGKTTTVANLLALHLRLADSPLTIALAAPTGKAAGRMAEALHQQLNRIGLSDAEREQIPEDASTLHRLLSRTEERGLLPSARRETLPYDLIVVDEASMIDLQLMYRLLAHTGEQTRLILLGDRNQLASVEAGSVFSDLCRKPDNRFSRECAARLRASGIEWELPVAGEGRSGGEEPAESKSRAGGEEAAQQEIFPKAHVRSEELADQPSFGRSQQGDLFNDAVEGDPVASDSIVYLTKSYRYREDSGIAHLSEAILAGERRRAEESFTRFADLHHHPFRFEKVELQLLTDEILDAYSSASKLRSAEELLHFWKRTMRLTVLRQGPPGSQWLNRFAEQQIMLKRPGLVRQGWYHGRPFIVTQNDYSLGIFNGDTGVALLSSGGELEAHVESGSGVKIFSPGQLAHIEPAYFLTVHKSQGSEFDHVQLILPPTDTPILSRELIYTAISRARKSFTLRGEMKLFLKGAGRKTIRFTGL